MNDQAGRAKSVSIIGGVEGDGDTNGNTFSMNLT